MKRRQFVVLVGGASVARSLTVHAQPQAAIPHHGYLWLRAAGEEDSTKRGLRQGLGELGYVEGRNIIVDYRYADGREERLGALVGELIATKVDIILAPGSVVTSAVKKATTSIPVVSTSGDPIGSGFIQSLGRPAGRQHHGFVDQWRSGSRRQIFRAAPRDCPRCISDHNFMEHIKSPSAYSADNAEGGRRPWHYPPIP
jgi:hypothetical protein